MTTIISFHEVEDGERWAKAWKKGTPGNRHDQFGDIVKARTFRDPENPNSTGLIFEILDMAKFQAFMQSDAAKKAMAEDGLKLDTMRMLVEFTP